MEKLWWQIKKNGFLFPISTAGLYICLLKLLIWTVENSENKTLLALKLHILTVNYRHDCVQFILYIVDRNQSTAMDKAQDESLSFSQLIYNWIVTERWLNEIAMPFNRLSRPLGYHSVDWMAEINPVKSRLFHRMSVPYILRWEL